MADRPRPLALRSLRAWVGRCLTPRGAVGRRLWRLRLHGPFPELRTRAWVTRLIGPQYRRSRRLIEIDITYACNLACDNCNRSVPQAPSSASIGAAELAAWIAQWERDGARWERVRLLGGEPTLHPEFLTMLELLRNWRDRCSPKARIEVTTNGFGPKVAAILAAIPADVSVNNSAKQASGPGREIFDSFNVAPRDLPAYARADYSNGCRILHDCGMGLAPGGYYHCAVAAGIDRELGRPLDGQVSSPSWEAAYAAWRLNRARPRPGAGQGSFPAAAARP
jgi:hypothetical protein